MTRPLGCAVSPVPALASISEAGPQVQAGVSSLLGRGSQAGDTPPSDAVPFAELRSVLRTLGFSRCAAAEVQMGKCAAELGHAAGEVCRVTGCCLPMSRRRSQST